MAIRGWAIGAFVYVTAMFHRTSLGVAGLRAEDRFAITPAQLSIFVLVQLGVYAAMQIPTGVLVDRFGPRRMLTIAAAMMGMAQLLFAVVPNYPTALLARALLGCGDALTFVSVLRFAVTHFSRRRYPLIVALTGMLGQVGNLVATVPLTLLLRDLGWAPTFSLAASLSLVAAALVWLALPEPEPVRAMSHSIAALRAPARRVRANVRTAWDSPGTKAGFWVHFCCMSTPIAFAVLWGAPYLIEALGFSTTEASQFLLVYVGVAIVVSPMIAVLVARRPAARVPVALLGSGLTVLLWAVMLAGFGGHPPNALVLTHVMVLAVGGPLSMIGFGLARDYNPPALVGTATGVVNVGGFLATVLCAVGIGAALSVMGATDSQSFRAAFAVAVGVQVVGIVQAARWWLVTRAHALRALERGESVPVTVVRHRFDLAGYPS